MMFSLLKTPTAALLKNLRHKSIQAFENGNFTKFSVYCDFFQTFVDRFIKGVWPWGPPRRHRCLQLSSVRRPGESCRTRHSESFGSVGNKFEVREVGQHKLHFNSNNICLPFQDIVHCRENFTRSSRKRYILQLSTSNICQYGPSVIEEGKPQETSVDILGRSQFPPVPRCVKQPI